MRVGGERVTLAIMSAPQMTVYGLITALPLLIRKQAERSTLERYIAMGLRFVSENTAHTPEGGRYLGVDYDELIHPAPPETRTKEEIISHMKNKLAKAGTAGESV